MYEALAVGNYAVHDDIYWQHLAYDSGGILEMAQLNVNEELDIQRLVGWALIDMGFEWRGSEHLLDCEQNILLQSKVYGRYAALFGAASIANMFRPLLIRSPLPGDIFGSFAAVVPGRNPGDADDRWKWITESMVPFWQKLTDESAENINQDMLQFLRGR